MKAIIGRVSGFAVITANKATYLKAHGYVSRAQQDNLWELLLGAGIEARQMCWVRNDTLEIHG